MEGIVFSLDSLFKDSKNSEGFYTLLINALFTFITAYVYLNRIFTPSTKNIISTSRAIGRETKALERDLNETSTNLLKSKPILFM
jgi:hypothetical protein